MTREAWRDALLALLPPGELWDTHEGSNLWLLFDSLAEGFARGDGNLSLLEPEMEPETIDLLLADWERILGLPNTCLGDEELTEAERRAIVDAHLSLVSDFSEATFSALAAKLGITVTFEYFSPFTANSSAGDSVWSLAWRKTMKVYAAEPSVALECLFRAAAPFEVDIVFEYGA